MQEENCVGGRSCSVGDSHTYISQPPRFGSHTRDATAHRPRRARPAAHDTTPRSRHKRLYPRPRAGAVRSEPFASSHRRHRSHRIVGVSTHRTIAASPRPHPAVRRIDIYRVSASASAIFSTQAEQLERGSRDVRMLGGAALAHVTVVTETRQSGAQRVH